MLAASKSPTMNPIEQMLDDAAQQYFRPLVTQYGLCWEERKSTTTWAAVSATGTVVRVELECDRGALAISLGSINPGARLWGIEQISSLFPRVRQLSGGTQRLSLQEQVGFLANHWDEVNEMFKAEQIAITEKRLLSDGC